MNYRATAVLSYRSTCRALERDLRVVVIGNQIVSYWRKAQGFLHNIAQGGEVDVESDPELQAVGREKVKQFCQLFRY